MDLKAELEHLAPGVEPSRWPGHEHVQGYGVFGLPLSSGHVLALHVFPINDFAPYVTVWHQTPDGEWSIYYDAPRPDIACPRYYGAAVRHIVPAKIDVNWRGPSEISVRVPGAKLEWTLWMEEPLLLQFLNFINKRMPFWTWKHRSLLKPREWIARALGLGVIKLAGKMPSGHFGILMPQRIYLVDRVFARLRGEDLGAPIRIRPNPQIGNVTLPARGVFAIGQAHWEIIDDIEYHHTRAQLAAVARHKSRYILNHKKSALENVR